jgi:hypothetical protein
MESDVLTPLAVSCKPLAVAEPAEFAQGYPRRALTQYHSPVSLARDRAQRLRVPDTDRAP